MYSRLNLTVNQHQLPLHISFPLLNLHFNHLKDTRDFFPKTDHNMTMVRVGEINSTLFFCAAISVVIHKSTSPFFNLFAASLVERTKIVSYSKSCPDKNQGIRLEGA